MPKIKSVNCIQFKRFTDLTITDIPESARLVILLGPNGSGKSSVFDAFSAWTRAMSGWRQDLGRGYYNKDTGRDSPFNPSILPTIQFHTAVGGQNKDNVLAVKAFYIRSAYRHSREFEVRQINRMPPVLEDADRPYFMAASDERLFHNYERVVSMSLEAMYKHTYDSKSIAEVRDLLIGRIRESLINIFGNTFRLDGIGDPLVDGTFVFSKGSVEGYLYKNLSGGERAAFDLILDMVVKRESFNDTVFAIDEPDLHLHSAVHGKVLAELYALIPEDVSAKPDGTPPSEARSSQLWTACHSAGMLKEAFEINQRSPGSVVFLDFNGLDFDQPVVMRPAQINRNLWKNALSVALHDLADLVSPERIVICEGKPSTGGAGKDKNAEFDAFVYRSIFSTSHPETEFVSGGNTKDITKDAIKLKAAINIIATGASVETPIDGDNHSTSELAAIRKTGQKILSRYSIENYLWSDEILRKLAATTARPPESERIVLQAKDTALGRASGVDDGPHDLVKDVVGTLCSEMFKQIKELRGKGSNSAEFAKAALVPLITSDTATYRELERDIFG